MMADIPAHFYPNCARNPRHTLGLTQWWLLSFPMRTEPEQILPTIMSHMRFTEKEAALGTSRLAARPADSFSVNELV